MKKTDKNKTEKKNIKKILMISVCVLLVGYFVFTFLFSSLRNSNVVTTEIAKRYTYSETISAQSIIVRNETLVKYNGSKVLYYTAKDGDIVSAASDVALVFSDEEDALAYNKYNELIEELNVLKRINTSHENVKTDYSSVDKQIEIDIVNIISAVNTNSATKIKKSADDLINSINLRHIITGKINDFNEQISALESKIAQYSSAKNKYIDVVSPGLGGYFVASADGYENTFDYNNVENFTVSDFDFNTKPEKVRDDTIGKIVSGLNWYIVCKLTPDEALSLSHSDVSLEATFPNTTCRNLPVSLVALNQTSKQSEAVAVFKCNYMNDAISHLRNEVVHISVNTHTGLKVSKDALHNDYVTVEGTSDKESVLGVYICYGSELKFREVSILYSGSDFVIVDEEPDDGVLRSGRTIKLNDEIVTKGEDLYEGKNVK